MADTYLKYSQTSVGKNLCRLLALPVPPVLKRAKEAPWTLVVDVLLGSVDSTVVSEPIKRILKGQMFRLQTTDCEHFDGLVFDATQIKNGDDSKALYQFFHLHLKKIRTSGKIVIIGLDPKQCQTSQQATIQRGLVGFIKALAKEVGRKGVTANLIFSATTLAVNISAPVHFLLSYRSAYVNGQVFTLNHNKYLPETPEKEVNWKQPLTGKVALVTGASRGIGASIAQVLARDGATVIGLDMEQAENELTHVMGQIGGRTIITNITDNNAAQIIANEIAKLESSVDIVVHNAGITRDKMIATMSLSHWEEVMAVNLTSIERINAYLLKNNHINAGGRIICVSSISGIAGNVGQSNYAMSKASIVGMIDSMAEQLNEKNITINAVAPGFIETQMTASIPFLTRFVGRRMCALYQGGLPVDVAETIAFFAAPQSQGLSANLVRVCGLNMMGA